MDLNDVAAQFDALIAAGGYCEYGVRRLHEDEAYKIGDAAAYSHVWDDGEDTGMDIGGTCCFEVRRGASARAVALAANYNLGESGRPRLALIGGAGTGNNDLVGELGSIAIRESVILAIVEI